MATTLHQGNLVVKPLCAKLTYDTEVFGKMDPYCKVRVGTQEFRTHTHNDAGKNPSWSDSLTFRIAGENMLNCYLYDKDVGSDDFIAEANINLTDIFIKKTFSNWYPVSRKGKSAGQIMIQFEFYPDASAKDPSKKDKSGGMGMHPQGMMQPGMMQQPMMQQPMMQQPMHHQPMMQQPMMQQPMYGQPQQPMYGQPHMAPPPMQPGYGAPPPMYPPQGPPGYPPMGAPPPMGPPGYMGPPGPPPMGPPGYMGPPGPRYY